MRRMHWWGAAAGVGALAVAAVGVPTAFAANQGPSRSVTTKVVARVAAAPVHVVAKHGDRDGDHDGRDHGPHHRPGCDYPPHGRPDVSISGAGRAHRGQPVNIGGLMKINGCGYENYQALLYRRVTDRWHHDHWNQVASHPTDKNGAVTFTVTADTTAAYRIFTAPDFGLAPGASGEILVSVGGHDHDEHHR